MPPTSHASRTAQTTAATSSANTTLNPQLTSPNPKQTSAESIALRERRLIYRGLGTLVLIALLSVALLVNALNPEFFTLSHTPKMALANSKTTIAQAKTNSASPKPASTNASTTIDTEAKITQANLAALPNTAAGSITPVTLEAETKPAPASANQSGIPNYVISGKNYVIQIGTFTRSEEATALQTKLHKAGLSGQQQTEIQLGPFTSLAEVVKAQERLKRIGIADAKVIATANTTD